jgi:HD-GYP domain-containing protein (c-di-GMP phosphodiesterase class II)
MRSLESAVAAIAELAEVRDPYTAGHQSRVADLSAVIAVRLGLPESAVQGIRVAASIHDIGKIAVPAEILTKPGRLTTAEYELIKVHPQVGADVVKSIEFPWPVAQMILEHHERLDGSGYPKGLRGEQIGTGSRVLAVADVVEAMAHFRPYGPGLGVPAALEEIRQHRGTLYGPEEVDACLAVFEANLIDWTDPDPEHRI